MRLQLITYSVTITLCSHMVVEVTFTFRLCSDWNVLTIMAVTLLSNINSCLIANFVEYHISSVQFISLRAQILFSVVIEFSNVYNVVPSSTSKLNFPTKFLHKNSLIICYSVYFCLFSENWVYGFERQTIFNRLCYYR